jgi:excisionase family DNA binding protein
MSASDPYLTVSQVAQELNVSVESVRDWIAQGRLVAIRPGRRAWRVRRSDLDRMLRPDAASSQRAAPVKPALDPWRDQPYEAHVTRGGDGS